VSAPLLTVVTICRNALPALRRTVESVQAQRFPGLEYLIVDGGSSDGTREYLRGLEREGVRGVSEPDLGISDAMNKGMRLATGTWVAHLHADDTYLPAALERMRPELAAADADVLCGWILKKEDGAEVLCRCDPMRLPLDMTVNHPASFTRHALLDRLGGFDVGLRNAMDYDFFLRAYQAGARFRVVPEALTRVAGGGQSEWSLWKTLRETHEVRRRHLRAGLGRSPLWLAALYAKGSVRIGLQRAGLRAFVAWHRRRFSYPRKG
jgi:glycosyltransferase involved in cell wall biosynthesis